LLDSGCWIYAFGTKINENFAISLLITRQLASSPAHQLILHAAYIESIGTVSRVIGNTRVDGIHAMSPGLV